MHSKRLFTAAALALLVCATRPVRAQGISGDDIGPHGCIQTGPDVPATMISTLPAWLTGLQARLGSVSFRWPSAAPQRARLVSRPVAGGVFAALWRPRD